MSSSWPADVVAVNSVSCGTVLWRTGGVLRVTVLVKAAFALAPDGDAAPLAPEPVQREDRYHDDDPSRSLRSASETAPYLPSAGVVLSGHAHASAGPVTALSARLALFRDGPLLDKTLHVFGDTAPGSSGPEPFERMPLVYERALGGPSFPWNPVGISAPPAGDAPAQAQGPGARRPNLVNPANPHGAASFGPIAPRWPARRLLQRVQAIPVDPGSAPLLDVPDGFDFRAFNPAPFDQQLPFLQGDEWIVLDNLTAGRPRIQTRLPSARARALGCWITARGASSPWDIHLSADSLAIDADRQMASIVWRGHLALERLDMLPHLRLFAGIELPGQPIRWPDPGAVAAAERTRGSRPEEPPVPELVRPGLSSAPPVGEQGPSASPSPPAPRHEAPHKRPGRTLLPLEITQAALPFTAAQPALPFAAARPALPFTAARPALPFTAAQPAVPLAAAQPALPFRDAPAMALQPPPRVAAGEAAKTEVAVAALGQTAAIVSDAVAPMEPPRPPLVEAAREVDLAPPAAEPPAPSAAEPPAPPAAEPPIDGLAARRRAEAKLAEGLDLDGEDLSGGDLSGLDFSGRSLARCALRGAKLRGARLADARLVEAALEGADLCGADLSRAVLTNARADGAELVEAVLEGADLSGASLSRANLQRARLARARGDGASLRAANLEGADLAGARFVGASFEDAILRDVKADQSDFTSARLDRADLGAASLRKARLVSAVLAHARLDLTDLRGADLTRANLHGAARRRAKIAGARMNDIDDAAPASPTEPDRS
ncbi:uncharacterized protein SOCE26_100180 [Sorangium cellulosum]|uniref:DUF2169 domain-containing protein n=1 Tax=Sorangium cellulosum TaxID=56 RepID=A0A2L0FA84_SORCE|nr:DUF2169 domain-containing protein [Sorangium cellulosum]AUX48480.1 uncharacterized protein SOCE26_100180 [Sorangium cellulosum]